jgi:integrase
MQLSALALFGSQRLRRIAPEDIARFNGILRERGCSPSTRAKHLRVLGACLQAAVSYRYADSNPVRELPPAQRPRPERKEAAYFENDELPRLFAHFQNEPYRRLCMAALKTGMRQGELLALRWSDVDLEQAVIRVRASYTGGSLGTPKNRERKDVDLISAVVELLSGLRNGGSNDGLVFPGENGHGFLSPTVVFRRHSPQQWLPPRFEGSGRRRGNGRSTASGTHLRSAHSRAARRSPGSHVTSATHRSGGQDGGRFPSLKMSRTEPVLADHQDVERVTGRASICRHFPSGPGRDRTCDLGIKSPLLYRLSYRPVRPV